MVRPRGLTTGVYRLHAGDIRILYEVDDQAATVYIINIGIIAEATRGAGCGGQAESARGGLRVRPHPDEQGRSLIIEWITSL